MFITIVNSRYLKLLTIKLELRKYLNIDLSNLFLTCTL